MKAIFNGKVVAEANKDDLIFIEGNWYFPPSSVKLDFLSASDTPYTCPWKGECQYYHVKVDDETVQDGAFTYPQPKSSAIDRVKKDFSGYYVFWNGVEVQE